MQQTSDPAPESSSLMRLIKKLSATFVRSMDRSSALCLLVLLGAAIIGFLPAALDFMHGDDAWSHYRFNHEFREVLRAGVLYPRWSPNANQGDGSPTFVFYSPLTFYATAAFSWKFGVEQGMKIAAFLFWCGSGFAMYVCSRQWLSRVAALLAALTYLFLPYHPHDLYERAALAEFAQFLWPPLIVTYVAKLRRGGAAPIIALAFCIAGSILTHLITAGIVLYLLIGVAVYTLFHSPPVSRRIVIAIAWGIALAGFYLLPAVWERQFINPVMVLTEGLAYGGNFLLRSPSLPGQRYALKWASAYAALLSPLLLVCALPRLEEGSDVRTTEAAATLRRGWLAVGLVAIFMMFPISGIIWRLPGLQYLEFPWRWLMIATFAGAFLVALQAQRWTRIRPIWRILTLISLAGNFCLTAVPWGHRLGRAILHHHPVFWDDEDWSPMKHRPQSPTLAVIPFAPKWIPAPKERLLLSETARRYRIRDLDAEAKIVEGSGAPELLEWTPIRRRVALENQTPVQLRLRTFYYPCWKCELDGGAAPMEASIEGRILLRVPAGRHDVACHASIGPADVLGRSISLLALAAAGVTLLSSSLLRRRAAAAN